MKKILFTFVCMILTVNSMAQTLEERVQLLEDRMALKTLVDTFSNLADEKNAADQILLFTEDATVTTYNDMTPQAEPFRAKGRDQIGASFDAFLKQQQIVYHSNGQQTVDIQGDKATGISYCSVTLVAKNQAGELIKTIMTTRYNDSYVKVNGTWLIKDRISHFTFRESSKLQ